MNDGQARYDRVAAGIHWITAVLVISLIILVLGGEGLEKATGWPTVAMHKSFGMTVFALTLFRLFWRLGHRPPPLPAETPALQRLAAGAVHTALYGFLLAMPLAGYIFGSGGPYPMRYFGLDVPKAPISKPVADFFHEAHEIGGFTLIALLVVHIGAALWHHFVQRDGLISRMRV